MRPDHATAAAGTDLHCRRLPRSIFTPRFFLQFHAAANRLKEDLKIRLRSRKKAELLDCACEIPSLPELEPQSINHAYTLISENYEKHRRSHSGNVFDKVSIPEGAGWKPLSQLRDDFEALNEATLITLCKKWWHKKQEVPPSTVWLKFYSTYKDSK